MITMLLCPIYTVESGPPQEHVLLNAKPCTPERRGRRFVKVSLPDGNSTRIHLQHLFKAVILLSPSYFPIRLQSPNPYIPISCLIASSHRHHTHNGKPTSCLLYHITGRCARAMFANRYLVEDQKHQMSPSDIATQPCNNNHPIRELLHHRAIHSPHYPLNNLHHSSAAYYVQSKANTSQSPLHAPPPQSTTHPPAPPPRALRRLSLQEAQPPPSGERPQQTEQTRLPMRDQAAQEPPVRAEAAVLC